MSHYTAIALKIKDEQCLLDALKALKLSFTIHKDPATMQNRWFSRTGEIRKAHIIVAGSELGIGADVGFLRNEDGTFEFLADDYELERSSKFPNFRQTFSEEFAVQTATKLGYQIQSRQRDEQGNLIAKATKPQQHLRHQVSQVKR